MNFSFVLGCVKTMPVEQWDSRFFPMEAKLTPEFEPFVKEYKDPNSAQFLQVQSVISEQVSDFRLTLPVKDFVQTAPVHLVASVLKWFWRPNTKWFAC